MKATASKNLIFCTVHSLQLRSYGYCKIYWDEQITNTFLCINFSLSGEKNY